MAKDITGLKFGKLEALYKNGKRNNNIIWRCKCDCGNEKDVSCTNLVRNVTKSCGSCPINNYVLKDTYIVGYDCNNNEFYLDSEDYDIIKKYTW